MSEPAPEPVVKPLAESALLIELGDGIDPAVIARVAALTAALDAAALPGVVDVVPAYTTVLVSFDPIVVDPDGLAAEIRRLAASPSLAAAVPARWVTIPVAYGGDFGIDLDAVAGHTGLSAEEVVARHARAEYLVACMGFAPGFGYLVGLPPELATPRLPNPRTRIPAGTVGIGGEQTGVYPLETPGGWRLIGRTPLRMFDPERAEPFVLRTGDHVRFRPIPREEFDEIAAAVTAGTYSPAEDEG